MAYTTIDDGSAHFQTATYTGNASTITITNSGNSDLQPDWVWLKARDITQPHTIRDSTRGTNKFLYISTADEGTNTYLTSFNSDGFSMNATDNEVNGNSNTYVAWQWKAGGGSRTTFTESGNNPGGGRQVNTTAGYSIIDYVGTGGNGTIAHGLGAIPKLVFVKNRDGGTNDSWFTHWTGLLGDNKVLYWNSTDGAATNASAFNSTAPTSTNITVGTNSATNTDGDNYIMYAFTDIKGYSDFGTYEGNGNASGPFIYTGFKPAFIMLKSVDSAQVWSIRDSGREPTNPAKLAIYANETGVESDHTNNSVDLLSNGFKLRNPYSENVNNETFTYMAFAEHPFVSSNGVPTTAR